MCFSPKVKIPKQDTSTIKAVDPAPLTQENTQGVEFGGQSPDDEKTSSETGVGSVKVDKNKSPATGLRNSIKSKTTAKK